MRYPFQSFHFMHILLLVISALVIYWCYQHYCKFDEFRQKRFIKGFGLYFLMEELIYTWWLLLVCKDQVWVQILPLELCSLCAYMNAWSAFTRRKQLCFFSAVVGLVAGLIAILYPANIDGLYPVFSYRVLNFYMLHGSFILFSFIQLKDHSLLSKHYLKKNIIIVGGMYTFAFVMNRILYTQYMFVGDPPNIYIVKQLYHITGIFFLPVLIFILACIQIVVVWILRKIYSIV